MTHLDGRRLSPGLSFPSCILALGLACAVATIAAAAPAPGADISLIPWDKFRLGNGHVIR